MKCKLDDQQLKKLWKDLGGPEAKTSCSNGEAKVYKA